MASDPTYPTDAAVGDDAADANRAMPLNETLSHAVTAKQAEARSAEEGSAGRSRKYVKGAAIGIGSAALVAAMLYARKSYYSSGKGDD